jgi:transcriptional regulator with XRE-family HTH domain
MAHLKHIGDWFRAAAETETEAETPITVGATTVGPEGRLSGRGGTEWLAFAKLVELRRRQCRLSAEDLAVRADVNLEAIVSIERGEGSIPEPRTVHQIAQVLKLPERRLLQLAGLVEAKDSRFREATVRFAARSEPIEDLRPEELEALEEYVKVLAE